MDPPVFPSSFVFPPPKAFGRAPFKGQQQEKKMMCIRAYADFNYAKLSPTSNLFL